MDQKVLVWDGKSFDLRCTLKEHVDHGGITKFRWLPASPYSAWLCTCSTDHTLKLFNAFSGQCIRSLQGHSDDVLDVDLAFGAAPGSEASPLLYVAAASDDKTCRVFKVALWTAGEVHAAVGEESGQHPSPAVVGRPQAEGSPAAAPQEGVAGTSPSQASRVS